MDESKPEPDGYGTVIRDSLADGYVFDYNAAADGVQPYRFLFADGSARPKRRSGRSPSPINSTAARSLKTPASST
ncbi:MAG: hypothetical protein R3F11_03195 [Verrucomicrobiales bacterium]